LGQLFPAFLGSAQDARAGGTSPVSKISDNEHTLASLGQSEILSVKDSVGPPIPALCQASDKGTKVPSACRRQDTGDVLPKNPAGPKSFSQPKKFEGQVAAGIGHASPQPGDGEGLARRASDKNVNPSVLSRFNRREVAMKRCVSVVMFKYRAGGRLNLGHERASPAERKPRGAGRFDAGAY
jgi:hypothetical protein